MFFNDVFECFVVFGVSIFDGSIFGGLVEEFLEVVNDVFAKYFVDVVFLFVFGHDHEMVLFDVFHHLFVKGGLVGVGTEFLSDVGLNETVDHFVEG